MKPDLTPGDGQGEGFGALRQKYHRAHQRLSRLSPTLRGLLWSGSAGLLFVLLNTLMRTLTLELHPFQSQFLRYAFGLLVMLPLVFRTGFATGLAAYRPKRIGGQFLRGALHSAGLFLWFAALPKIPLADMTAIGFTGPIFIMIGAYLFFKEPVHWERWLAAFIGFGGVLMVVGPNLTGAGGHYNLVMLASAPLFAGSFLMTKELTRYERTEVIVVWQAITVTLFSVPMAVLYWQAPTLWQWTGFLMCGFLGSAAHYCVTRSFSVADISATQSIKFLDLVWSALAGWLVFSDVPSRFTLLGGGVICASTLWIARRESQRSAKAGAAAAP